MPALDLTDPKVFASGPPHAFFDMIRREEPAYRMDDPRSGTLWSLTRHADIRMISANNVRYSSANGIMYPLFREQGPRFDNQMMFHSGARHSRLRIRLELDGAPQRAVDIGINALRKLPMRLS